MLSIAKPTVAATIPATTVRAADASFDPPKAFSGESSFHRV
jgi:hypothetical protein